MVTVICKSYPEDVFIHTVKEKSGQFRLNVRVFEPYALNFYGKRIIFEIVGSRLYFVPVNNAHMGYKVRKKGNNRLCEIELRSKKLCSFIGEHMMIYDKMKDLYFVNCKDVNSK